MASASTASLSTLAPRLPPKTPRTGRGFLEPVAEPGLRVEHVSVEVGELGTQRISGDLALLQLAPGSRETEEDPPCQAGNEPVGETRSGVLLLDEDCGTDPARG